MLVMFSHDAPHLDSIPFKCVFNNKKKMMVMLK